MDSPPKIMSLNEKNRTERREKLRFMMKKIQDSTRLPVKA